MPSSRAKLHPDPQHLIELLPQIVAIARSDGLLDYCTPYAASYLGIAAGANLFETLHPGDRFEIAGVDEINVRFRRASDSSWRWHLLRTQQLQGSQWLISAVDVQDRERQGFVQRAVKAGTWEIDVESGRVYRSAELRELYGVEPGQHTEPEADWTRFVHPEDAPRVRATVEAAIRSRSELRLKYRAHCKDGVRWLMAVGTVVSGRMAGITIDTTDFHLAEEAVRQTARLDSIGRLAGGVAHDFNNLLAGILGGASFIADLLPENHAARPMLDLVMRSSERAAHLTQQLLAYAGKGSFVLRPCDLARTVEEAFPLLRTAVPQNIEVVVHGGWKLPAVDADAVQIREIVLNLLTNAAEAIGENEGTVWVRTGMDHASGHVYLEVKDTGPGIDPAIQDRIFEPFFTTRFTGRGLGLSAVEGIVRSHSGSIQLENEPGRGAAFRILFPASKTAGPKAAAAAMAAPGATILVIDDEEGVRDIVQAKLERSGYRVLTAHDGPAGVAAFRRSQSSIALVILDVGMPGMSGSQVFDEFVSAGIDVPVVVTSGYQEGEALARIGHNRVAAFLQKPFSVGELARVLEKLGVSR